MLGTLCPFLLEDFRFFYSYRKSSKEKKRVKSVKSVKSSKYSKSMRRMVAVVFRKLSNKRELLTLSTLMVKMLEVR